MTTEYALPGAPARREAAAALAQPGEESSLGSTRP